MANLFNFTKEILKRNGALVEEKGGDIEAVFPAPLADLLGVKEYGNFVFSSEKKNGTYVSFDSKIFAKMKELLPNNKGRFSVAAFPPSKLHADKIKKKIESRIILNNAVFKISEEGEKPILYLLAFFKFTALSDERQEGIMPILINEFNLSAKKLDTEQALAFVDIFEEQLKNGKKQEYEKIINVVSAAAREAVREELRDFIQSINRRLNRDTQRIYEYYSALIYETEQFMEKKGQVKEKKAQMAGKMKAIETEFKWKINDLITKYDLDIQLEPISFFRIETVAPLFWLIIKRRKKSRTFPLTYNPILKAFDDLPCESCFNSNGASYVCDDELHLVCGNCFKPCLKCAKNYCRACHKTKCPHCGFTNKI